MPDAATKTGGKTLEPPKLRVPLGYEYVFNDADAERLREGLIPAAMEDKWFVYFDHGWLYLHRSWTGAHDLLAETRWLPSRSARCRIVGQPRA